MSVPGGARKKFVVSAPVLLIKTKEANKARDASSAKSAQTGKSKRIGSPRRRRFRKHVFLLFYNINETIQ